MIKIDKGIKLPSRRNEYAEALAQMEAGDSFLVADFSKSQQNTFRREANKLGVRFATRTVDGGVRIWRLT
jgi:hypothetical protein